MSLVGRQLTSLRREIAKIPSRTDQELLEIHQLKQHFLTLDTSLSQTVRLGERGVQISFSDSELAIVKQEDHVEAPGSELDKAKQEISDLKSYINRLEAERKEDKKKLVSLLLQTNH